MEQPVYYIILCYTTFIRSFCLEVDSHKHEVQGKVNKNLQKSLIEGDICIVHSDQRGGRKISKVRGRRYRKYKDINQGKNGNGDLSGYGNFGSYLKGFKLRTRDDCTHRKAQDNPKHTLFMCSRWNRKLHSMVGETITTNNIINTMLNNEENWKQIARCIPTILKTKKEEETDRPHDVTW